MIVLALLLMPHALVKDSETKELLSQGKDEHWVWNQVSFVDQLRDQQLSNLGASAGLYKVKH